MGPVDLKQNFLVSPALAFEIFLQPGQKN